MKQCVKMIIHHDEWDLSMEFKASFTSKNETMTKEKTYDHLNRFRKSICPNSMLIHDKKIKIKILNSANWEYKGIPTT